MLFPLLGVVLHQIFPWLAPSRYSSVSSSMTSSERDDLPYLSLTSPRWLPPGPGSLSEMILFHYLFTCLSSVPQDHLNFMRGTGSSWSLKYPKQCLAHSRHSIIPEFFHLLNKYLLSTYYVPTSIPHPRNSRDKTKSSLSWSSHSSLKKKE